MNADWCRIVGPRKRVLDGVKIGQIHSPSWRVTRWRCVKILWPLVIIVANLLHTISHCGCCTATESLSVCDSQVFVCMCKTKSKEITLLWGWIWLFTVFCAYCCWFAGQICGLFWSFGWFLKHWLSYFNWDHFCYLQKGIYNQQTTVITIVMRW